MFDFYFINETLLIAMMFVMTALVIAESAYTCVLISRYRMHKIRVQVGEIVLLIYMGLLSLMPVVTIVNRRYAIVDLYIITNAIRFCGIVALVYFVFLSIAKTKGFIIASIAIILSMPIVSEIAYGAYIIGYCLAGALLTMRLSALLTEMFEDYKTELSAFSINEGLDTLPVGVMFCSAEGYIYLTNVKMRELSNKFLRKEQKNGNAFWDNLRNGELINYEAQEVEGGISVRTSSEIWHFSRQMFKVKGVSYIEIIAIDATETMSALYTLEEEREKLEMQSKAINKLIRKKEMLQSEKEYVRIRTQVHDVLSQRLTAIQRMSTNEEFTDYNALLFLSKDAIETIKEKQGGDAKELFGEMYHYFWRIGLSIELLDELPEEEYITFLLLSVLREACTNSIKHAGATKVFVKIDKSETQYEIEITNNGARPKKSLTVGGGLAGMRNRIEGVGGSFRVEIIPEFSLNITIRRGNLND